MIRPYTDDDLDRCLDVWWEASQVGHAFMPEDFFEAERQLMVNEWFPTLETYVYEVDSQVVGFITLKDDYVGALFVHPDYHGQDVALELMDRAREEKGSLELDVFEANERARRFYEKYGFKLKMIDTHQPTGQPALRLRLD